MTPQAPDYPASFFVDAWSSAGYVETRDGYDRNYLEDVLGVLRDRAGLRDRRVLEIGPGGGVFSRRLQEEARHMTYADVIARQPWVAPDATWIVQPSFGYTLPTVEAASIDTVFSFGVFCHLSVAACAVYLGEIHRVLRPDGAALIMWPDERRRVGGSAEVAGIFGHPHTYASTMSMVEPLFTAEETLQFRDLLLLLRPRAHAAR